MPELALDFYYWVMPRRTNEWEVMQRVRGGWIRTGIERILRDTEVEQMGPMIEGPATIRLRIKKEKRVMEEFIELAEEVGFTKDQAEFMYEHMARRPHTHTAEEILGIEDVVEEALDEALAQEEVEEAED
jgi:16S rRNA C967 or C1407 C5-methylase (RsmB/RsmF family)